MKRELEQLRADIAFARRLIDRHFDKLASLDLEGSSDEASCALVSLTLHHVYAAVEKALKHIASTFKEPPAEGESWHRDLLESMSRDAGMRPRVISQAAVAPLAELLAFRHYLIHGSLTTEPDPARLRPLRARALGVRAQLSADLEQFDQHLAALVTAAEG